MDKTTLQKVQIYSHHSLDLFYLTKQDCELFAKFYLSTVLAISNCHQTMSSLTSSSLLPLVLSLSTQRTMAKQSRWHMITIKKHLWKSNWCSKSFDGLLTMTFKMCLILNTLKAPRSNWSMPNMGAWHMRCIIPWWWLIRSDIWHAILHMLGQTHPGNATVCNQMINGSNQMRQIC